MMRQLRKPLYLITALCLFVAILGGGRAATADEASGTGNLQILLVDQNGTALPGGCFQVVDAAGNSFAACADGGGSAWFSALSVGTAQVAQTSNANGNAGASVDIAAGETAFVTLVNESTYEEVAPQLPASDSDGDGVLDDVDACAGAADLGDSNGNGIDDACEALIPTAPDTDGDGVADDSDACPGAVDQGDNDGSGTDDACESVEPPRWRRRRPD